jgi:hypothetical protein
VYERDSQRERETERQTLYARMSHEAAIEVAALSTTSCVCFCVCSCAGNGATSYVDVRDVAACVMQCLTDSSKYNGDIFVLTGQAVSAETASRCCVFVFTESGNRES